MQGTSLFLATGYSEQEAVLDDGIVQLDDGLAIPWAGPSRAPAALTRRLPFVAFDTSFSAGSAASLLSWCASPDALHDVK